MHQAAQNASFRPIFALRIAPFFDSELGARSISVLIASELGRKFKFNTKAPFFERWTDLLNDRRSDQFVASFDVAAIKTGRQVGRKRNELVPPTMPERAVRKTSSTEATRRRHLLDPSPRGQGAR